MFEVNDLLNQVKNKDHDLIDKLEQQLDIHNDINKSKYNYLLHLIINILNLKVYQYEIDGLVKHKVKYD